MTKGFRTHIWQAAALIAACLATTNLRSDELQGDPPVPEPGSAGELQNGSAMPETQPAGEPQETAAMPEAEAAGEPPDASAEPEAESAEELVDRPVMPDASPTDDDGIDDISQRSQLHREMLELVELELYDEATATARRILELTEEEFGPESIEVSSPLENLATLLMLKGDLVDAEAGYKRSIAVIERHRGILSKRLVNPYIGLGATYNRAGLFEQAEEAFSMALRLSHVNDGFYNSEQFKIRDGLTETYIGLEDLEEANFHQETQVYIQKRKMGEDNPDIVPSLYKLGRWYERIGQMELARNTYQSAQRLLRKAYGKDDAVLVDTLEGISRTYELQGLMSESSRALKNALEILENTEPPDHARRADVLVQLGDLYTRNGKIKTARAYYEDAWQELSIRDEDLARRDEYFAEPVRIGGVSFHSLRYGPGVTTDEPELLDGSLLVRYDVDADGRAQDVTVVESDPEGMLDKQVTNILSRSWFRPRLVAGQPVTVEDQLYQHEFRYRPQSLPDEGDDGTDDDSGRLEYPEKAEPDPRDNGRLEYPAGPEPDD